MSSDTTIMRTKTRAAGKRAKPTGQRKLARSKQVEVRTTLTNAIDQAATEQVKQLDRMNWPGAAHVSWSFLGRLRLVKKIGQYWHEAHRAHWLFVDTRGRLYIQRTDDQDGIEVAVGGLERLRLNKTSTTELEYILHILT